MSKPDVELLRFDGETGCIRALCATPADAEAFKQEMMKGNAPWKRFKMLSDREVLAFPDGEH